MLLRLLDRLEDLLWRGLDECLGEVLDILPLTFFEGLSFPRLKVRALRAFRGLSELPKSLSW